VYDYVFFVQNANGAIEIKVHDKKKLPVEDPLDLLENFAKFVRSRCFYFGLSPPERVFLLIIPSRRCDV